MTSSTDRDSNDPAQQPSPDPPGSANAAPARNEPVAAKPAAPQPGDPFWILVGPQGLRSGWSILLFILLIYFFANILGTAFSTIARSVLHLQLEGQTAGSSIVSEGAWVAALALTLFILSRIERRRFVDYYLAGPAVLARFCSGLISGFAVLSALVALLYWGGWIRFGAAPHPDSHLLTFAGLWAIGFLFVGLVEEGCFRCYLQFTLTRGINFWWALAAEGGLCLWDLTHASSHGAGGVYAIAALGFFPCLYLHLRKTPRSGFWQAAWVSSTLFGFIHTGNNGETWIGIFAAASIGFVFCVSVRLTGSAWWAIGCHAAWDWAETYFYGTADSGFVARGHLLTTLPVGSALWSGGTDGPEGSLLVLPVILLLLLALMVIYGGKRNPQSAPALAGNAAS
jgi:membrane protease YdiL (CAAX protease family)